MRKTTKLLIIMIGMVISLAMISLPSFAERSEIPGSRAKKPAAPERRPPGLPEPPSLPEPSKLPEPLKLPADRKPSRLPVDKTPPKLPADRTPPTLPEPLRLPEPPSLPEPSKLPEPSSLPTDRAPSRLPPERILPGLPEPLRLPEPPSLPEPSKLPEPLKLPADRKPSRLPVDKTPPKLPADRTPPTLPEPLRLPELPSLPEPSKLPEPSSLPTDRAPSRLPPERTSLRTKTEADLGVTGIFADNCCHGCDLSDVDAIYMGNISVEVSKRDISTAEAVRREPSTVVGYLTVTYYDLLTGRSVTQTSVLQNNIFRGGLAPHIMVVSNPVLIKRSEGIKAEIRLNSPRYADVDPNPANNVMIKKECEVYLR